MNPYKLKSFRERLFLASQMYITSINLDPYWVLEEMEFVNDGSNWPELYNWLYLESILVRDRAQISHMFNKSLENIDRLIAEVS